MSRILMLSITLIWIIILIPQFMCKMPDFDGEYIFLFFFFCTGLEAYFNKEIDKNTQWE